MAQEEEERVTEVFAEIASLENEFAIAELESFRLKEFNSRPLYTRRQSLFDQIPNFWPTVFGNLPREIQQAITSTDLQILAHIKSFRVERFQVESAQKGDPRSIRFTFEFHQNEFFEDAKLVKEFKQIPTENALGGLVSNPVPIKWKSKKMDPTKGLLALAHELYLAEEAARVGRGSHTIDLVERQALWQYEKLDTLLSQVDGPLSFFSWFGYRGPVVIAQAVENDLQSGNASDSDDDVDEADDMLEVEICPDGYDIAVALAEDFWPNVMDYFMATQVDPEDIVDGRETFSEYDQEIDSDADVPDLISSDGLSSPRKRRRTTNGSD